MFLRPRGRRHRRPVPHSVRGRTAMKRRARLFVAISPVLLEICNARADCRRAENHFMLWVW